MAASRRNLATPAPGRGSGGVNFSGGGRHSQRARSPRAETLLGVVEAARECANLALDALSAMGQEGLDSLQMLDKPPQGVRIATEAVVLMVRPSVSKVTWVEVQTALRHTDIIEDMEDFDVETLKEDTKDKVAKLLHDDAWDVNAISRASRVAGPMALWVEGQMTRAATLAKLKAARTSLPHAAVGPFLDKKAQADEQAGLVAAAEVAVAPQVKRASRLAEAVAAAAEAVEEANKVLCAVDKESLDSLRTLNTPPQGVRIAMVAVVLMVRPSGSKVTWVDVQTALRYTNIIEDMQNYDVKTLREDVIDKVLGLLRDDAWDVSAILQASSVAGSMALWVQSQMEFACCLAALETTRASRSSVMGEAVASSLSEWDCVVEKE